MNYISSQFQNAINAHPRCVRLLYQLNGINPNTPLSVKFLDKLFMNNPRILTDLQALISKENESNFTGNDFVDDILNIFNNNTNDVLIDDNKESEAHTEKMWLLLGFGFLVMILLILFVKYKLK